MDPVYVISIAFTIQQRLLRPIQLVYLYGASGLVYYVFGNRTIWRTEMQVLGNFKDEDALNFKKSVQEECSMISVAVSFFILVKGLEG